MRNLNDWVKSLWGLLSRGEKFQGTIFTIYGLVSWIITRTTELQLPSYLYPISITTTVVVMWFFIANERLKRINSIEKRWFDRFGLLWEYRVDKGLLFNHHVVPVCPVCKGPVSVNPRPDRDNNGNLVEVINCLDHGCNFKPVEGDHDSLNRLMIAARREIDRILGGERRVMLRFKKD